MFFFKTQHNVELNNVTYFVTNPSIHENVFPGSVKNRQHVFVDNREREIGSTENPKFFHLRPESEISATFFTPKLVGSIFQGGFWDNSDPSLEYRGCGYWKGIFLHSFAFQRYFRCKKVQTGTFSTAALS